jgi:hypothetical protein
MAFYRTSILDGLIDFHSHRSFHSLEFHFSRYSLIQNKPFWGDNLSVMRLTASTLTLALLSLFICTNVSAVLERKRTPETTGGAQQCTKSDNGEEVCENIEAESILDGGDDDDDDNDEDERMDDDKSSTGKSQGCVDRHENCGFWASKGECDANSKYMVRIFLRLLSFDSTRALFHEF